MNQADEPIIRDWSLVLTFRKHGVEIINARRHTKAMLTALRNMANKNNWFYKVVAVVSERNPRNHQKERIHVHVKLFALPASTVKNWIKQYWHTRHGIVEYQPVNDHSQLLQYMVAQASAILEQERTHEKLNNNREQQAE